MSLEPFLVLFCVGAAKRTACLASVERNASSAGGKEDVLASWTFKVFVLVVFLSSVPDADGESFCAPL